ncbi:MAG: cytochrome c [Candidatus Parabeggiatoa sp. nov. 2]|nr:MAG: cytochrome C [Beggiatoa sp. 4572_84]RKZ62041.1 MAG: cytochrome c [Gammaproteobacteria bacterium]
MSEIFTKSMARNIYYGGSAFFILLFLALTFDTSIALPKRDHRENITPQVAQGKVVWEVNDCVGCHTLLGEGSYYAPELGNVYKRRGGGAFIKAWIKMMPTNIPGRRKMPQFNLSEEELDALVAFLKWSSEIDTAGWPPNIEG